MSIKQLDLFEPVTDSAETKPSEEMTQEDLDRILETLWEVKRTSLDNGQSWRKYWIFHDIPESWIDELNEMEIDERTSDVPGQPFRRGWTFTKVRNDYQKSDDYSVLASQRGGLDI